MRTKYKILAVMMFLMMISSCKRDPEILTVELYNEQVIPDVTSVELSGSYNYPSIFKNIMLYLSDNEDMDESEVYEFAVSDKQFSFELTNLKQSTRYYYFYGFDTGIGVMYSDKKSFVTLGYNEPEVKTSSVTAVTDTTAECGGEVVSSGGSPVTVRGVCWSINQNPTTADSHTEDGTGTGTFTSEITELAEDTKYYVRAYATNEVGTAYGEERIFTTLTLPFVSTKEITNITEMSATSGGDVLSDGNSPITARGVCWSTSPNPTIADSYTNDGMGTGTFTSEIIGLEQGTTYYVRAYATNAEGTAYGGEKDFMTDLPHEAVDLGLPSGLKWATCNVGANFPEEYGNYYAWGEITTKESYTLSNCTTWDLQIGDISGNAQYDAARANWGDTWRMPTKAEFDELINYCEWVWTTQQGNNGYLVTGPNGNHIFLPAAGYRHEISLFKDGEQGYSWSSTPDDSDTESAYLLHFHNGGYKQTSGSSRYFGRSVRPVTE